MRNITTINSIELSSLCNNTCPYCPAPAQGQHRPVGFMDKDTFKRAIAWVKYFRIKGTQRELNLFGVGEPLMNPDIIEFVAHAREELGPHMSIHLNTNGILLTEEIARALKAVGISHMDLTGHNPRIAARSIRILRKVGIPGELSMDFMTVPNNWAGQVDWFEPDYEYPCQWLRDGQVMIMSDGSVTTCCIDAFARGVFAHVSDDLSEAQTRAHELCKACHHIVPAGMLEEVEG